jgi:sugar/nucleoside kinase (ribokinase family)
VLAPNGLVKGSMTLIDLAQANAVQQSHDGTPRFVSGGSVANTAVGLSELGGRAGFIGAVADDEVGHTYVENLRGAGVEVEAVFGDSSGGRHPRERAVAWCSSPTTPSAPWAPTWARLRP